MVPQCAHDAVCLMTNGAMALSNTVSGAGPCATPAIFERGKAPRPLGGSSGSGGSGGGHGPLRYVPGVDGSGLGGVPGSGGDGLTPDVSSTIHYGPPVD